MGKNYFITGTDTDVGKTVVTAGLAALCVSKGLRTAAVKPVQTGTADYRPDLETVRLLAPGICDLDRRMASPLEFPLAASPHLAAREAGVRINLDELTQAVEKVVLETNPDALLVEGAGGVMVPLNDTETMLDLMRALGFPAILVSRPGLGTINHTLLSVGALRRAGVEVCGVIFNKVPAVPGKIEADNMAAIEKMGGIPILGAIEEIDLSRGPADFLANFKAGMKKEFPL